MRGSFGPVFFVFIAIFFLGGCGCGDELRTRTTPPEDITRPIPADEMPEVEREDERDDEGSRVADVFSVENTFEEVRRLFLEGRYEYAASQAESLIPRLASESRHRLETHFLAARSFEHLGDEESRRRHDEAFRALLELLGTAPEHRQRIEGGKTVRQVVERAVEMTESTVGDHEAFLNVRCHRRLQRASPDEVLTEKLDSGTIFFGLDAEAVRMEAVGSSGENGDMVVLQRDPRFGFFFVIIEDDFATGWRG